MRRWFVLGLTLAAAGACHRSPEVPGARDAGAVSVMRRDLVCVEQPDGCLRCADRSGEAPFLDAEQARPTVCEPDDPENCVEFCSVMTANCALPWWKGATCLMDTELAFDRSRFNLETADRAEAVVMGRVVDEAGKRVEGARVRVWLSRGSALTPLLDETAGKDGVFRLRLKIGPWSYALRLAHPGSASEIVDRLALERSERQAGGANNRIFRLGPEHMIRGRVVDNLSVGVGGASVTAVRGPDDAIDLGETRTAEDGSFALGGLEARRYFLRVTKFGWRPLTIKAPVTAPATKVVLKLSRANAMKGSVVDSKGEPEPNATVAAVLSGGAGTPDFSVDWKTDAEGKFAEDHFAAGTYYLWARRRNMLVYPPEKIELAENQEIEVQLKLSHKGARVLGSVVAKNGYSLGADARVVLLSRSPLAFPKPAFGEIDPQGKFIVAGVLPGRYELSVRNSARTMAIVSGPRDVEVPVDPDSSVPLKAPVVVRPLTEE